MILSVTTGLYVSLKFDKTQPEGFEYYFITVVFRFVMFGHKLMHREVPNVAIITTSSARKEGTIRAHKDTRSTLVVIPLELNRKKIMVSIKIF